AVDQGESIRGIALYLSSQHIPTGKEGAWNVSLIKRYLANRHSSRIPSDQPILAYGYLIVSDENGNPYTEASIAQIIYGLHDQGLKERNIAKTLNKKHIPTGREASWTPAVVSDMLSDEFVIGKA